MKWRDPDGIDIDAYPEEAFQGALRRQLEQHRASLERLGTARRCPELQYPADVPKTPTKVS